MKGKVYERATKRTCSDIRSIQENRNREDTESMQEREDGVSDNESVEADGKDVGISDEEGEDNNATVVEHVRNKGNRMPNIRAGASGVDDNSSLTTNSRTQVTDVDSFRQHETIMGNMLDIKKTTMEVAQVVRTKIFKSTKFTNCDKMFDFQPERDDADPMRGVFYCFLRKECKHQGGDDGIWWAAVQKEVHRSIAKKRTTVTQAMKMAFVGMIVQRDCCFLSNARPTRIAITHYDIQLIT